MRIISKFHDYYDGVTAYDYDRSIIYKRDSVNIKLSDQVLYPDGYHGVEFFKFVIGFCGKIYHGINLRYTVPKKGQYLNEDVSDIMYNKDNVLQFINGDLSHIFYLYANTKYMRKHHGYDLERITKNINKFFAADYKFLIKDEYPIFLATRGNVEYNAKLSPYDFQKVLDPYTAYQTLRMHVEGMAQPLNPIPQIDDNTMQGIKGFDHEYSFRKEPSKK